MNCPECGKKMKVKSGKTPEGVKYDYFQCSCGEELLGMEQLHSVAKEYREMKKYTAKVSKWGDSFAIRIPKDLVKKYRLKQNKEITLIPEENSITLLA